MIANIDKITTFKEIMDWVCYDWDTNHELNRDDKGNFYINKLYIEPKYLTYKTECAELEEGLFEQLELLYAVIHGVKFDN